jgi:hypothetical protein
VSRLIVAGLPAVAVRRPAPGHWPALPLASAEYWMSRAISGRPDTVKVRLQ